MGPLLSKKELNAALEKLREQYRRFGEKYDRQVFNLDRFNERYMQSLRIGMPTGHFLAGEVQTFQELKQKAEEKYAPPEERAVSDKVDRMLEAFAARTRRYPAAELCPRADEETCRLVGMLQLFRDNWSGQLPPPRRLPPGTEVVRLAAAIEERAFQLIVPGAGGHSRIVGDFIISVSRITAGEGEQAALKKEFFKETGFFLNLVRDLLEQLPEGAESTGEALAWVEEALDAFRLREFRLRSL